MIVCPSNQKMWHDNCLVIPSETISWHEARSYCQTLGSEYDLVYIDNHDVNVFLQHHLMETNVSYWIGLNDLDQERAWKWSNGKGLSYDNWKHDEPNVSKY